MNNSEFDEIEESIAIIGMSCRLPGAKNPEEFWQNLKNGVESITFFSDQELLSSGIDPAMLKEPNYIKAKGALDNVSEFDAAFFGFSPKEAEITDPQQRLFLECAWEALENAGYDPKTFKGIISLYGGVGANHYLLQNLYANPDLRKTVGDYQILINNDKDFLCTRVSYKLNLSGPSVTVQTACSTSLVAITMAYQSLLDYQSDIALAGGVSISLPNKSGYLYQEGMIMSPDGHCRAFDANAQGTVSGNGVGIVVLKRLEDALNDGDHIEAVIKGAAINNDGALKIGYTAPSVEAQAQVIAHALEIATVPAETVSYVETHGTGTSLGDPIEIAALTRAFRADTDQTNYCAIGSVKTNIGHLDVAAGVVGLIKTVLALKHRQIPPSLHFETPNPKLDLDKSPFYVNTDLSEWKPNGFPRRAGISSFGIGGTNAHVVLEEAPAQLEQIPSNSSYPASTPRGEPDFGKISERPWKLLLLSAYTKTALEAVTTQLVEHLKQHPKLNLADVAYTYQVGRCRLNHRRILVTQSLEDAVSTLETRETERVFSQCIEADEEPSVVFMFSGQGSQYVNMGLELYQTEPVFREQIDRCAEFLKPYLGLDLRTVLYGHLPNPLPEGEGASPDLGRVKGDLDQTAITQPALFITEYALAKLWMSWGVQPKAMIGHSIGEYVAACLAGVFTLEEALILVATRGKLMQSVPPGTMLAVPLSEEKIQAVLPDNLDLAAINVSSQCVVSGSFEAIEPFISLLTEQGIEYQRLHTSHAFHSEMMSPILTPFLEQVQKITLKPPQIPFISNVSGTWITEVDATDPYYWIAHLRQMVRFADGLKHVLQKPKSVLLEIGPGHTLSTFAKRHPNHSEQSILSSLRHPKEKQSDSAFLLNTLGQLWMSCVTINWTGFYADEQRYRLPLPTYPFERQRYWIEASMPIFPDKQAQPRVVIKDWQSFIDKIHQQIQTETKTFDIPAYAEQRQWINRLCAAYVNLALQKLGAFHDVNQAYSINDLVSQFHILPFYRQMFPRCVMSLVKQDQIQQIGDKLTKLKPISKDSVKTLLEQVQEKWTQMPEQVELIRICGEKLADIVTGKENPRELLFTGSTFEILQSLYQNSPSSRAFNTIMQTIVKQIVKALPPKTPLSILEIGAGTGATTAYLLPELPSQRTHYVFTDIGTSFLHQAQQKFSEYSYLEYRGLDIDQNPVEQGYKNHSFDIIIAAQVLHATKNLGKTLEHVRSLLAPGGILLFWEPTQSESLCFDVAFPLLQPFEETDELRSQHPFLTTEQWYEGLRKYGFVEVESFPQIEELEARIFIALASSSEMQPSSGLEHDDKVRHKRPALSKTYVPPRNETEQIIANLWQKFFSIESIGIHDDFFQLGGDSLMAVQLVAELQKNFEVELSSHSLLQSSTIATLAELIQKTLGKTIEAKEQILPFPLINIQTGKPQRPPLFMVHPVGGHVYFYHDLASALGSDQPVYGLQQQGVDGKQLLHTKIEDMATQYVNALRTFKPSGPYCLGGASFGGVVAFEMAQQLQALGEKIALLVMMDTPGPSQMSIKEEYLNDDVRTLAHLIGFGLEFEQNLPIPIEQFNQFEQEEQLRYLFTHGEVSQIMYPDNIDIQEVRHLIHVMRMNFQTMNNYIPKNYPTKILFFRALEPYENIPKNTARSWMDLATGGMDIHEVPGHHINMIFYPHVEKMAKLLRKYLDRL